MRVGVQALPQRRSPLPLGVHPDPKDLMGVRGRSRTPVAVILRSLVVKRLSRGSGEQTERCVTDRLALRQSCWGYLEAVTDDIPLIRWAP